MTINENDLAQKLLVALTGEQKIIVGTGNGIEQDGTINVSDGTRSVNAIATSGSGTGPTVAIQSDDGNWYGINSTVPQQQTLRITSRHSLNPSAKKTLFAGLIASANNYIQDPGEARITAAIIALLIGDIKTWDGTINKNKPRRKVACLIGPTYTPLQPIRNELLKYNYVCTDVSDTKWTTLENYDVLIARVVHVGGQNNNEPFIFGDNLAGIEQMLKKRKIVYLGGCGCPYGSRPFNDVLSRLGFKWSVQETRSLPESKKPVVVYPWVTQENSLSPLKLLPKKSYTPYITDRTVFSGVSEKEVLVRSTNGQIMMAYSPFPKCVKKITP